MMHRILATRVATEQALVPARDRTRQVGDVFGLDSLQRTRFITAVSEIARNAVQYAGGGMIEFHLRRAEGDEPQALLAIIVDKGPGIERLDDILGVTPTNRANTALGITGSRRLVDRFAIESSPGEGTTVTLEMRLPLSVKPIDTQKLSVLIEKLANRREQSLAEELEQQNREMLATLETLRMRQVELEQADERKDEFLAMLAHELRNPLAAIRTALEVLKRKQQPTVADTQRLGGVISRQTEQLARLVNDLLDVSRVTRGKIHLNTEALQVRELIDHALEMTDEAISAKKHTITIRAPHDNLWVMADRVRFKQILGNLLHNAARYTPAGGAIEITVASAGPAITIAIADNGIGIAEDMLPRVFDLFTQAQTGLGRQDAGLGVGLTVVQRMLQEHGGSIAVGSAGLGQGATFTLTIPALDIVPALPDATPAVAGPAGLSILVIDDNEDAADVLQQILEMLGHRADIAHTGEAGVARARELVPDVVIADIGLPGMNGFEVAGALRSDSALDQTVLVALSGYSAASIKSYGRADLFDQYLEKPVAIDVLEAMLGECAVSPRLAAKRLQA